MHDSSWRDEDESPLFDVARGRFFDFASYPPDARVRFYSAGIDALESIGAAVAALTSMHYLRLMGRAAPEKFRRAELARQHRLRSSQRVVNTDLEYLRFLDTFSLFVCMTSPAVEEHPLWLKNREDDKSVLQTPNQGSLTMRWTAADRLAVFPFPFDTVGNFEYTIPVVHLPRTTYPNRDAALADYRAPSNRTSWTVFIER
ncbi:hypothetical protein CTAYLR_010498 [Chrysophaeum taylorii]|uniref:Uncharacterized protein n=1 Tax=Chrysophaeum taylorii TaxID=2483200 RepID=A0AAD7UI27_9STRA|nr:hypothetical protein CTAYLR_010498 [Chrysophaeum taylorii]